MGLPEQLIALRILSLVMFGSGLFLGFEENTAFLGGARGVGAVLALLAGPATVQSWLYSLAWWPGDPRRRRAMVWTYATGVLAGAAGFGLLVLVGRAGDSPWTTAGAVAIGLALGARVLVGITSEDDGQGPRFAHDGEGGGEIVRFLTRTHVVTGSLVSGVIGLVALLALFGVSEVVGGDFIDDLNPVVLGVGALVFLPLLVIGLAGAGLFSILPLGLFAPALSGGLLRRFVGRSSAIQPLPDLLATAITSAAAQIGQGDRRATPDRRGREPDT